MTRSECSALRLVADQLHVEDELLAGERVVAVNGDVLRRDFGDDDFDLVAVLKREREAHADLRLDAAAGAQESEPEARAGVKESELEEWMYYFGVSPEDEEARAGV